ncbi:hypothetical protein LSH36_248g01025 [Paralvinella palmiformis]|uniref:Uncharacterized protein n=1 Tax=Paralvinella palmiformis TaxID=53620 RepID=A0AAD9JLU9_9ANNE|nr:hypothetical protein LSH36_248g01025 [Paralvinella palmiformis]
MTTTSHHRTALLVIILVKNVTCRKCITWRRNNYKCISGTVFSKKSDGRLHHMMRTLRYQVHSLCKTTLDLCFKHTYNNWLKHAVAILVFAASIVIYIYIITYTHTHPHTLSFGNRNRHQAKLQQHVYYTWDHLQQGVHRHTSAEVNLRQPITSIKCDQSQTAKSSHRQ